MVDDDIFHRWADTLENKPYVQETVYVKDVDHGDEET
jgi:hypothetical protein